MNKQKFNEMVAMKAKLEGKINALRESQRRSSLSFLIEDTIEKAEIVLAAKAIVDKFGKMAEDMAKVEGDELMPMMDSLKSAFGPQMAEAFQKAVSDRVRAGTQSMTQLKDAISGEVSKLEAVANGQAPANDMGTDDLSAPPVDPALDDMSAPMDAPVDPAAADPDLASLGADADFGDMGAGPAGRARKESAARPGKPLTEGLLDSIKSVLTAHFDDVTAGRSPREQLEALKPFITASDYEVASQFPDHLLGTIFDRTDAAVGMPDVEIPDSGVEITDVPPAPVPGMESPLSAPPVPAMGGLDNAMDDGLDDDLDADLHGDLNTGLESDPLDLPFESAKSPSRRLRESKNPDAVIFSVFSKVVREGTARKVAARKVAETFGLDYSDVVAVIREAEEVKLAEVQKNKPGRDWKKLYTEAKADGLTKSAIITFIAESSVEPKGVAAVRAWIAESEKQDAIFGKKGDKKTDDKKADKSKGKPWEKKDDCDKDDCDKDEKKLDEAEASDYEVVWINDKDKPQTNSFKSKEEADKFAVNIKKGGAKAASVSKVKKKLGEAEGDVGFQAAIATPMKYPEASNPAFKDKGKQDGKGTDKSEKPMVVGGAINPSKGNPASAGKMAGAKIAEAASRAYHVVAVKHQDSDKWGIHFGDYDKSVARQEMVDEKESAKSRGDKDQFKLITVDSDKKAAIDAAIAKIDAPVTESEGDTGFPVVSNKEKGFPEATNPAFKKNTKQSGKTDPAGTSPVVGKKTVAETSTPVKKK